jgi:hypothetical protein
VCAHDAIRVQAATVQIATFGDDEQVFTGLSEELGVPGTALQGELLPSSKAIAWSANA